MFGSAYANDWLCLALRRFRREKGGAIAIAFGLSAAFLVVLAGGAVDFAWHVNDRTRLQVAADQSAMLIAREMRVAPTMHASGQSAAGSSRREEASKPTIGIVRAQLAQGGFANEVHIAVELEPERNAASVALSTEPNSIVGRLFGIVPRLSVTSTASTRGLPVCVVALGSARSIALGLADRARMRASGCAIHANSPAANGIDIDGTSDVEAGLLCSAGGVGGRRPGRARSDCPAFEDPFAARPRPSLPAACDHRDAVFNGTGMLSPGVYCGDTVIRQRRQLRPGVYVFRNGDLVVEHPGNGEAGIVGRDVVLVFDNPDRDARVRLAPTATVDLDGSVGDPQLAGFLFYQVPGSRRLTISIESRQARNVVGTVYLPNGTLDISADRPVADRSAYTIIVADELRVRGGPTLTLNTDYFATDVPVPVGVGPGEITIVR